MGSKLGESVRDAWRWFLWFTFIATACRMYRIAKGLRAGHLKFGDFRVLVRLVEMGDTQRYGVQHFVGFPFCQRIIDARRKRGFAVHCSKAVV